MLPCPSAARAVSVEAVSSTEAPPTLMSPPSPRGPEAWASRELPATEVRPAESTLIAPPEASPRAWTETPSRRAVAPVTSMLPPSIPSASSSPLAISTAPAPALSTILPPLRWTLATRMTPSWLTTLAAMLSRPLAVRKTEPPSATISPLLATNASIVAPSTSALNKPSRSSERRVVCPAASATPPLAASMRPELRTVCAESRTTKPPSRATMCPWLMIAPSPLSESTHLPAESWVALRAALATSPPTSTRAPAPKMTPFGLSRNTFPLELRLPRIWDWSLPMTRLMATESEPGWTKRTELPAPMLKDCQSTPSFEVVWLIVIWLPVRAISAAPCVTFAPCGSASPNRATAEDIDAAANRNRNRLPKLPDLRVRPDADMCFFISWRGWSGQKE